MNEIVIVIMHSSNIFPKDSRNLEPLCNISNKIIEMVLRYGFRDYLKYGRFRSQWCETETELYI